ncbi:MAG: hypothetical protein EXR79_03135 [Myxococcales bacterium]|nr:hypothetical protein [Myxococcales bacterium]
MAQLCTYLAPRSAAGSGSVQTLSDVDLVAVLIGPTPDDRWRACALVARQASLAALGVTLRAPGHDLDGASHRRLLAAVELGCRALADKCDAAQLRRVQDLVARYRDLALSDAEQLVVVCLDAGRHLVAEYRFHGGLDSVTAPLPLLLRRVLESGAPGFALVHNHPSGDPRPSAADRAFTERVAAAARLCDLRLFEHVVVAARGWARVPGGTS